MTPDEYNALRSIQITLENAFSQKEHFWTKEIMASAMTSLDYVIKKGAKHQPPDPIQNTPCPECNPTGVFNYSPHEHCICNGKAWLPNKLNG